jgi:peptidoglycan/LPS O-acetylase OafA/YrhL
VQIGELAWYWAGVVARRVRFDYTAPLMGVIRLFLALVVAIDHWRVFVLAPRQLAVTDYFKLGFNAGQAVFFFYVISGFLITYTLSRNYAPTAEGVLDFYKNRFIRIFSLFWPLAILTLLVSDAARRSYFSGNIADQVTGLFLLGIDWRLAFADYPNLHSSAIYGLSQSWTVGAELTFYLFAPFLIHCRKVIGVLLVLSLGLRAAFVWELGPALHATWTYHFIATTFGFFLLGQISCLVGQRFRQFVGAWSSAIFLMLSVGIMTFGNYDNFDSPRFWLSLLCFVAALPGIFEATKRKRILNYLGDLSYPVYLVHIIVLFGLGDVIAQMILPHMYSTEAAYVTIALYLGVVILSAMIVHHAIEQPCARLMHWSLARRTPQAPDVNTSPVPAAER